VRSGVVRESVAPIAADAVSTTAAANSQLMKVNARPMLPNCLAADVSARGM
jgi:hypothetical protein